MSSGKSTYLANKHLDHVLKNVAYTAPSTVYAALYTATPNAGGGGTEVSGTNYARLPVAFSAAASGSTHNTANLIWTAGWAATVVGVGIHDASTSGNLLYFVDVASLAVGSTQQYEIAASAMTVTEGGAKSTYLANKLLDHTLRNVAYTPPSDWDLALYSVAPTAAGGGTELAGDGYSRLAVQFDNAASGVSPNLYTTMSPVSTAPWSDVVAIGVFDAYTLGTGNLLYFKSFSAVPISVDMAFLVVNGALTVAEA